MDTGKVIGVVLGALIAYIVAQILVTTLITGTAAGDQLVQNIVPIVCAAGAVILILRTFLK